MKFRGSYKWTTHTGTSAASCTVVVGVPISEDDQLLQDPPTHALAYGNTYDEGAGFSNRNHANDRVRDVIATRDLNNLRSAIITPSMIPIIAMLSLQLFLCKQSSFYVLGVCVRNVECV